MSNPPPLSDLELTADCELETEDSKEFLSEISFLKSLDEEELLNVFKHSDPWNRPVLNFFRLLTSNDSLESFSPEKADSMLNSLGPISKDNISRIRFVNNSILSTDPTQRDGIFKILKMLSPNSDLSKDDLSPIIQKLHSPYFSFTSMQDMTVALRIGEAILKKSRRLSKGQQFFNKWLSLNLFLMANQIKGEIKLIRNKYLAKKTKNKPISPLFQSGFTLGVYIEFIVLLNVLQNPFFQRDIHDALSSSFVSQRYKKLDALYRQALKRADDLWKKGDPRWHYQMARDLILEEEFRSLNVDKLKKMLLPIAAPYKKDYQFERIKKHINTPREKSK